VQTAPKAEQFLHVILTQSGTAHDGRRYCRRRRCRRRRRRRRRRIATAARTPLAPSSPARMAANTVIQRDFPFGSKQAFGLLSEVALCSLARTRASSHPSDYTVLVLKLLRQHSFKTNAKL
jgi:hypothetical protein